MVHDAELNSPFVPQYHSRAVAGVLALPPGPNPNLFPLARAFWLGDHVFDALDGGVAFTAGGIFAIEKNTTTGDLRFITPMGTWNTTSLSAGLPTSTEIRPLSVGIILRVQDFFFPPTTPAQSIDIHFRNFYGRLNGGVISGAACTAADPGIWLPWAESDDFFTLVSLTPTQQTSDYEALLAFPSQNLTTSGSSEDAWYRPFNGPDRLGMDTTDMETAPEHGVLWRATASSDMVLIENSFDNGHSWLMVSAFDDVSTNNSSPSLTWYNQRLYVTWFDGTAIRSSRSLDGGMNWAVPTTLPFTGTNPRHIVDRTGGGSFYFYFDGSGNLKVSITYDGGGSWDGPFTVGSSLTPQQIDAEFAPDGSIITSLFVGGVWTQYRSRDLGVTWA